MKSINYLVLWGLHYAGQGSRTVDVANQCGMSDLSIVGRALSDLCMPAKCDGESLVTSRMYRATWIWSISGRKGRGTEESTGGWRVLEESATRPEIIEAHARQWKDEALTGITNAGQRSEIQNAVLF